MRTAKREVYSAVSALLLLWMVSAATARTIYVDADATGANDGSSWADAYNYLQDALMMASAGDRVLVAQGVYKPNQFVLSRRPNLGRRETFQLKNGVAIRGGYAGFGEPDPNARNIRAYETILSGDLDGNDAEAVDTEELLYEEGRQENSYNVVTASDTDRTALLDGCTITGGQAWSEEPPKFCYGGGLYAISGSAIVRDCNFVSNTALNYGGGVHIDHNSAPLFVNCAFSYNSSTDGGGLNSDHSSPTISKCVFIGNAACSYNADGGFGGGMYSYRSNVSLARCVFSGNSSDEWGGAGGFRNREGTAAVANCIFSGNSAGREGGGAVYSTWSDTMLVNCTLHNNRTLDQGAAVYSEGLGNSTVKNCIVWADDPDEIHGDNVIVSYSNVWGGYPGAGNTNQAPLFADPHGDDYHLKSQAGRWDSGAQAWAKDGVTSPCIDTGDPNSNWTEELWPHGKRINMGAFGGTAQASMSLSSIGLIADLNNDRSVDHTDMKLLANKWSLEKVLLSEDLDRNGIVNFADFAILADNWLRQVKKAAAGETIITYVHCPINGNIAVRIQLPESGRYPEGAPIVVVASTWFVKKYTPRFVGFDVKYDPTEVGAIFVTYLWPGKEDPETGAASEGTYDFGGPKSLAALRGTILFASGLWPDVRGYYINELMEMNPLTDNVGLYASSHAGVVATNVLAYHAEELSSVRYFVGRENPTRDEMYALEFGHFDDARNPVFNPYYDPAGYTPNTVSIDHSKLGWIQNASYPEGMPYFEVPGGPDHILPGTGPDMEGKRFFSRALTRALLENGAFTLENWPDDLAKPQETEDFWPYRITVNNYHHFKDHLPNLRVMLVFARDDHVQAALDKPHIHQAYDGFRKTGGLWVRLNADEVYFLALDETLQEYPENDANTEPEDWMNARQWGYPAAYGSQLYVHTGSLAGIAEMADRVKANDWRPNLDEVLYEYAK